MINLSTGPVTISPAARQALSLPEISHRSPGFIQLFQQTVTLLCDSLQVRQAFILTGSGTLANDAMMAQIAQRQGHGLVVSNGEFGERLALQADRSRLRYTHLRKPWGSQIDMPQLERKLIADGCQWLLICHCETSTGQLVDLRMLSLLCKKYDCEIFIDCMSSFSLYPMDLSQVAMATASSGKGAGSLPGLALLFSNIEMLPCPDLPIYLDLHHAQNNNGIPFTMPSHLLNALYISLRCNLVPKHWQRLDTFGNEIYNSLSALCLVPFANEHCRVFTLVPKGHNAVSIGEQLEENGIRLSYQSQYLKERNWLQLAVFGYFSAHQIDSALKNIALIMQQRAISQMK